MATSIFVAMTRFGGANRAGIKADYSRRLKARFDSAPVRLVFFPAGGIFGPAPWFDKLPDASSLDTEAPV